MVDSSSVALRRILEHPGSVATWSAQRSMAASLGLELRAPLLDRTIVEFVLRLPTEQFWDSAESKPFLRAAGRGRVPDEILRTDKHVALFQYMLKRALSHEDPEAVAALLMSNDALSDFVQLDVVLECLRRARLGALSDKDTEALYELIATARWMRSVTAEYRG
jgi:asparagine synthetase B (glutamine-hydrolysing)